MTTLSAKVSDATPKGGSALNHSTEGDLQPSAIEASAQDLSCDSAAPIPHEVPWDAQSLIHGQSVTRRIIMAGVTIIIGLAVWCFWPLSSAEFTSPPASSPQQVPQARHSFDTKPFDSMIWSLAALPPPPPAPPPPPPAVKVQLIAITQSAGSQYQATLYDPDIDKLITVREGTAVGRRMVTKITKSSVTLTYTPDSHSSSQPHHHVLALDPPPSDAGGKR